MVSISSQIANMMSKYGGYIRQQADAKKRQQQERAEIQDTESGYRAQRLASNAADRQAYAQTGQSLTAARLAALRAIPAPTISAPKLNVSSAPTFAAAPKATIRPPTNSDISATGVKLPNFVDIVKTYLFGTPDQKKKLQSQQTQVQKQNYLRTTTSPTAAEAAATDAFNSLSFGLASNSQEYRNQLQTDRAAHPIASTIGNLAGYVLPSSVAEKGVSIAAKPILEKLGTSVAAKIARPVITSAIAQGGLSAINDASMHENKNTIVKNAALNAGVGALLGGAGTALHNVPLIRSAVKEAGIKGLVIPEEKLGSGLARSAEARAVENASRLMPDKAAASTAERQPSVLSRIPGTPEYIRAASAPKLKTDFYAGPTVTRTLDEQPKLLSAGTVKDVENGTPFHIVQGSKIIQDSPNQMGFLDFGNILSSKQNAVLNDMAANPGKIAQYKTMMKQALDNVGGQINKEIDNIADYISNYKGKGVDLISHESDYGTPTYTRSSRNELWYRDVGGKVSKKNARAVAADLLKNPRYAGELYDPEMTEKLEFYSEYKPLYDEVFGSGDVSAVDKTAGGYRVQYANQGVIPRSTIESGKAITPINAVRSNENVLRPRTATTSAKLNPDFIGKSAAEIKSMPVADEATATTAKTLGASKELGAMNKSAIQTARETYGSIPEGEQPWGRPVDVPVSVNGKTKVMRFTRTALEAPVTDEKTGNAIQSKMMKGGFSYVPESNKKLVQQAESRVLTGDVSENTQKWLDPEHGSAKPSQRIADGEVLYRDAINRGDTKSATMIAEQLASDLTENGRAVQAARILKALSPESNLFYVQKEVSKMNETLAERYGTKAPRLAIDEADVKNIINATTPDEISKARDAALANIAQNVPATWQDRLNAWRYLAMLGNPKTHIRNILGNALFQPMRKFSDIISAGMEKTLKVGERQHAVLNPFSKSDKAIMEFAKSDYAKIGDVLGGSKFNDLQSAIRENQPIFTSKNKVLNTALKPLEGVRKFNDAALEAEDRFFSGSAYKDYLAQYMKANHYTPEFMSSGTKEAAEALEKGRNFAIQQAKRATFNEANSLATALNRMEKRLDKTAIGKAANVAIEGTLPFKRTPMNIIKRGLEYSPANLIKGIGEELFKVRSGKVDAATAIEHISEGITGSGLLALGAFLGANGIINGPITATGKSKAYGSMNGDQAYSLNILGHTYTIDWMSPAIMPVMMGAELFQNHLPKSMNAVPSFFNSFVNSLSGISDPVFNLTMLQGVNNLFSVAGSQNAIGTALSNAFPNYASQLVPTVGGQIARTLQPNRKTTYTGNALLRWTGANKAIAKVPGLANTLPDYRNLWGQTESNGNVGQRILSNFVSPGYVGTRLKTPVDAEVQRLFKATDSSALPNQAAADSVSGYRMSPEEQQRFQKIMGQQSYRLMEQLIDDPTYQSLPDYEPGSYNDKVGMVSKIYSDAKKAATIDFYQQRGLPVPDNLTKVPKVTKSKKPNAGKDLYQQIASWGK